ncbi:MAG: ATP-binding cassette domain-containing protein [Ignavibacteriales bacterium]
MIQISDLNFGYRKKQMLFQKLNISLMPGNIYGLLGRNGAGKTTLLKIIGGLLNPVEGRCSFRGFPAFQRNPKSLEETVFLPDNSYLPPMKAAEYLNVYAPFYSRFSREKCMEYLENFEVPMTGKLSGLSFGQKKKFSIAFALAANSKVLLMDEPTNGLDIPAKSIFRKLVASSITDEKIFLVSTHQVKEMKNLIDPIIILDEGRIVFHEPVHEIEKRYRIRFQLEKPDQVDTLYYESTPGGYVVLTENKGGFESEIDIELLFNAVISRSGKMSSQFQKEAII